MGNLGKVQFVMWYLNGVNKTDSLIVATHMIYIQLMEYASNNESRCKCIE